MSILTKIPENLRGWFYFILAVVMLLLLVGMFVLAVLDGTMSWDNWMPVILSALGLAGAGTASANTERESLRKHRPPPDDDHVV